MIITNLSLILFNVSLPSSPLLSLARSLALSIYLSSALILGLPSWQGYTQVEEVRCRKGHSVATCVVFDLAKCSDDRKRG